jgi:hypothetical protein
MKWLCVNSCRPRQDYHQEDTAERPLLTQPVFGLMRDER